MSSTGVKLREGGSTWGHPQTRSEGGTKFGDNHKVKLGKKRSKTNGVKLSKMASNLWVSLGAGSSAKKISNGMTTNLFLCGRLSQDESHHV